MDLQTRFTVGAAAVAFLIGGVVNFIRPETAKHLVESSFESPLDVKVSQPETIALMKGSMKEEASNSPTSPSPTKTRVRDRTPGKSPSMREFNAISETEGTTARKKRIDRDVSGIVRFSGSQRPQSGHAQSHRLRSIELSASQPAIEMSSTPSQDNSRLSVVATITKSDTSNLSAHEQATIRELNAYVEDATRIVDEATPANTTTGAAKKRQIASMADEYLRITLGKDVFNQLSVIAALQRRAELGSTTTQ